MMRRHAWIGVAIVAAIALGAMGQDWSRGQPQAESLLEAGFDASGTAEDSGGWICAEPAASPFACAPPADVASTCPGRFLSLQPGITALPYHPPRIPLPAAA